jgi:hypothetical protein
LYTNSAKEVTVLGGIAMVDPSPVLFTQHFIRESDMVKKTRNRPKRQKDQKGKSH